MLQQTMEKRINQTLSGLRRWNQKPLEAAIERQGYEDVLQEMREGVALGEDYNSVVNRGRRAAKSVVGKERLLCNDYIAQTTTDKQGGFDADLLVKLEEELIRLGRVGFTNKYRPITGWSKAKWDSIYYAVFRPYVNDGFARKEHGTRMNKSRWGDPIRLNEEQIKSLPPKMRRRARSCGVSIITFNRYVTETNS